MDPVRFRVKSLNVEIHPDGESASKAAAEAAAKVLCELGERNETFGAIFATGASQLGILNGLVSNSNIPWSKIIGFHLDEYIGIDAEHPASFRGYLRKNLTQLVRMHEFTEIDVDATDLESMCSQYMQKVQAAPPQLCLMGFGENGHLAFNDPGEADFNDPLGMKIVNLDRACRQQQAAEGWFKTLDDVPTRAVSMTIPTMMRVPKLIATVPGPRKARAVKEALYGPITDQCPASILRTHPNTTVYLDPESAAEIAELVR